MPDLVLFSSQEPSREPSADLFPERCGLFGKSWRRRWARERDVRRDVDTAENDEPTVMTRERLHLVTSMLSARFGALCA
jgi:hypothetical protein